MKPLGGLLAAGAVLAAGQAARAQKPSAPAATLSNVPYTVVEQSGRQRVVLISPKYRSVALLRRLGEEFRDAFRSERIVFVIVFDDAKAARMFDKMFAAGGSLGREDAFYDKHNVAGYNKNMNSGENLFVIYPYGAGDDRQIDVKY